MSDTTHDVAVEDHGTIHLVRAITDTAQAWLEDHIGPEAMWFGDALAVEPRYTVDLLLGLQADGFRVPLEAKNAGA